MVEFDLFIFFRAILVVFLTTYTLLMLGGLVRRLIAILSGTDPQKEMLRIYVSYQLLTLRLTPLRGELLQIALWLLLLVGIWRLHALI